MNTGITTCQKLIEANREGKVNISWNQQVQKDRTEPSLTINRAS